MSVEEVVAYLEFLVFHHNVRAYRMSCTDRMYYILLLFDRHVCLNEVHEVVHLPRRCRVADPKRFSQYVNGVYISRGGDDPQPFWSSGDF